MDLNLLKILIKVADCGSLTKASKLLHVPKSKISRDLNKLEEEIGQSLLIRSPRGIIMTDKGVELIKSVRIQLDEIESSIERHKESEDRINGTIKLTAPEDLSYFLITPMIKDFRDMYPEVDIEIYATNDFLDFNKHQIDLAVRVGKLEDSSLIQKKVADITTPLIASEKYLQANPKIKSKKDLIHYNVATMRNIHGEMLNTALKKYIKPSLSTNSMMVLLKYLENHNGLATVPTFLCRKELFTKEYRVVFDNFPNSNRGLFLLSRPSKHIPQHVKLFKSFLFNGLKKKCS